ncbi:MAG: DUF4395 domain-containing protein [Spirochaetales bacterium]|nr:DUF4395 domain-containing protein [Spirochaetales bacterium]
MKKMTRPFRVNEAVVRGVALQVLLLALTAMITGNIIPLILLILDFGIRVFLVPAYSPLAFISRTIIQRGGFFKKRMIAFQPKRFAAMIGLTMTVAALICQLTGYGLLFTILLAILSLFSFLEGFFRFCAGCKIFALLIKLKLADEELCEDCVFKEGEGI